MKRKLTFIILGTILSSFIALIVFSTINVRNVGVKAAEEKATTAAELVKDGLTAHMVSGIMENREYFLNSIQNAPNIKSLWITRSPSVIEQFGKGFNSEVAQDEIDKQVIKTAKVYKHVTESSSNAHLRVTIPYIASAQAEPNCMACHDAKEGDVLGTVSIIIDFNDIRSNGINTSFILLVFSIIIMIIVFFILNKSLTPLIKLFESITYVMTKAQEGTYSKRVEDKSNTKEYANVAFWINSLLDKLEDTLKEIESTIKIFLTKDESKQSDILLELKDLVHEIATIHKFKKTIEFDETKMEIYSRIGNILKDKFEIDDFVLLEQDTRKVMSPKVVFTTFEHEVKEIKPHCRALRTKQVVDSEQFKDICQICENNGKHYYCIPFTISNELELMLHIQTDNMQNIKNMQKNLARFEDYINEARPEIVSKNLTEILRISSTTDPLTNLFNRKYLDEYIDKALAQAKRSNISYGIMMIDIDFFKMVNDTHGHDIGDKVIVRLSEVLKNSIRESDIAFRFGGEEFLVLLYNCDKNKINDIAQKIRTKFEQEKITANNNSTFTKTLSIGTSIYPDDTDSIWKAIKYADISLYKAKNSGRNQVVSFTEELLENNALPDNY